MDYENSNIVPTPCTFTSSITPYWTISSAAATTSTTTNLIVTSTVFSASTILTGKKTNTSATNTTKTFSGDHLIGELERVTEKEQLTENLMPKEDIFHLPKIPTILDNEDFEQKQKIKKQQDDEIKKEIDLTRLKDELDAGKVLKEIEFYFGGQNCNFFMCSKLNLNNGNENFVDFLFSDIGSHILKENMLSIHIRTGNIFYENYNT